MAPKQLKKRFKFMILLSRVIIAFWILETTFFLFYEGWHLKATNPIEQYCDSIVTGGFVISMFLFVNVLMNVLTDIFKQVE